MADKVRTLSRLMEIPFSSITERDVIRMLRADTGDLVNTLVRVSGFKEYFFKERITYSSEVGLSIVSASNVSHERSADLTEVYFCCSSPNAIVIANKNKCKCGPIHQKYAVMSNELNNP